MACNLNSNAVLTETMVSPHVQRSTSGRLTFKLARSRGRDKTERRYSTWAEQFSNNLGHRNLIVMPSINYFLIHGLLDLYSVRFSLLGRRKEYRVVDSPYRNGKIRAKRLGTEPSYGVPFNRYDMKRKEIKEIDLLDVAVLPGEDKRKNLVMRLKGNWEELEIGHGKRNRKPKSLVVR